MQSQLHWQNSANEANAARVPNLINLGQKFDTPSQPQGIIDFVAINLKTCRLEIPGMTWQDES